MSAEETKYEDQKTELDGAMNPDAEAVLSQVLSLSAALIISLS